MDFQRTQTTSNQIFVSIFQIKNNLNDKKENVNSFSTQFA